MIKLTDYMSYADAQANFSPDKLWELFDGNRARLNIAHECIDRHAGRSNPAVIVVHADGPDEVISFREIADASSRFAHYLQSEGVQAGDRVAIMLEPSRAFYVAMFGTMKAGAIAVPLFTLFGPDGVKLRVNDCTPRLIVTNAEKAPQLAGISAKAVVADEAFLEGLQRFSPQFTPDTAADAVALFQYTSGTTRELPEAVKHTHRSIVTLMVAALYGTGLRPGDRFFCPSSPAWGHGLWHGTLAPLALGITIGAYAGKFNPERLLAALERHRIHQHVGRRHPLSHDADLGRGAALPLCAGKTFVHRRADRQRNRCIRRANVRPAGLQHVRHHRDRRDPGELSRCRRLRRQARLARQANPRRQSRGT